MVELAIDNQTSFGISRFGSNRFGGGLGLARRRNKSIEVKLSPNVARFLKKIAGRDNLKENEVLNEILSCELAIVSYAVSARKKLARRLKLRVSKKFLFHKMI